MRGCDAGTIAMAGCVGIELNAQLTRVFTNGLGCFKSRGELLSGFFDATNAQSNF